MYQRRQCPLLAVAALAALVTFVRASGSSVRAPGFCSAAEAEGVVDDAIELSYGGLPHGPSRTTFETRLDGQVYVVEARNHEVPGDGATFVFEVDARTRRLRGARLLTWFLDAGRDIRPLFGPTRQAD